MAEQPVVGRIVELAAQKPALAIGGAEITREIVNDQRRTIRLQTSVISHIKSITTMAGKTDAQKLARIGEVIADYEKENT